MDKALKDLIAISRKVGKDTNLVQGGGGNTSVKDRDGNMFIKASGTALKDMGEKKGWRRLSLEKIFEMLDDDKLPGMEVQAREKVVVDRLNKACNDSLGDGARPSVESHIHAMLNDCVVHLHPTAIGAFVCAKDGQKKLEGIFKKEELPPLWVPYFDPGYNLAAKTRTLLKKYQARHNAIPPVLFMGKHGLFISAGSKKTALDLTYRIIDECEKAMPKFSAKEPKMPVKETIKTTSEAFACAMKAVSGQSYPVLHEMNATINNALKHKNAKEAVSAPALTPDELVYANGGPLWVEDPTEKKIASALKRKLKNGEKIHLAIAVPGQGLFVCADPKTAPVIRDVMVMSLHVRFCASRLGGVNALNKRQREFILNWEAESFRQKVSKS